SSDWPRCSSFSMVARRRSAGAVGGFWAFSGFCPRSATSKKRMRREAAFSDFIAHRECTGPGETKKAAPFGATLFKEARWRESEETQFGAAPGSGTDRVRCQKQSRVKLFQRCDLFSCLGNKHLPNQNGNLGRERRSRFGNLSKIRTLGGNRLSAE